MSLCFWNIFFTCLYVFEIYLWHVFPGGSGGQLESKYGHLPVTHVAIACEGPWAATVEWKIAIISANSLLSGDNALAAQSKWLGLGTTCYHMFSSRKTKSRPNDILKTESLSNLDEKVQCLNILANPNANANANTNTRKNANANNYWDNQLHFSALLQSL